MSPVKAIFIFIVKYAFVTVRSHETQADFESTQLKWSYPLSFNADSTHSKYMDAQSCTSANTDARERTRIARLEFRVVF